MREGRRVLRKGPLLKVGVIMMALALALVIAAVVVSATLRSEPEGVVAAEVAAKSLGEAPRYSFGEEGSVTKKSSSEKRRGRTPPLRAYRSRSQDTSRIPLSWRTARQRP